MGVGLLYFTTNIDPVTQACCCVLIASFLELISIKSPPPNHPTSPVLGYEEMCSYYVQRKALGYFYLLVDLSVQVNNNVLLD